MRQDGRLARMVHVLVHMGLLGGRETSERIAQMLNTNAVVVRRTMGQLRRHGIVASEGGRGGGWSLAKPLNELTMLDVQRALQGETILEAPLSSDHPSCPVEKATNARLQAAFQDAELALTKAFQATNLSDIARTALDEKGG
ncbi:Rrf2 family transcriptional regulator [Rhizobium sp. Leaf262]|uniref:RrF2 family transcriptional regulator n=1 Tax=Rhizobium sp. Leaf262 TaxID=1736312 RepID=UPI000A5EBAA7|nr:Rrf2 family transcriptional regulator [Rhizobium sp. Leaf262]